MTATDWRKVETFDGLGSIRVVVEIPDTPMVRVPRQMLERILAEAGYELEENK